MRANIQTGCRALSKQRTIRGAVIALRRWAALNGDEMGHKPVEGLDETEREGRSDRQSPAGGRVKLAAGRYSQVAKEPAGEDEVDLPRQR